MAAAAAAVRVAEGDDDAVRDWLDGVLKQVETRGRWRSTRTGPSSSVIGMTDRFIGAGIACVERKQRSVVLASNTQPCLSAQLYARLSMRCK